MPETDTRLQKLLGREETVLPEGKKRKPRRTKYPSIDVSTLHELSESELVEIARLTGHEAASRQLPREEIIDLILGARDEPEDPIETIRMRIYDWTRRFRRTLNISQFRCDLDCPNCPDGITTACYAENHTRIET